MAVNIADPNLFEMIPPPPGRYSLPASLLNANVSGMVAGAVPLPPGMAITTSDITPTCNTTSSYAYKFNSSSIMNGGSGGQSKFELTADVWLTCINATATLHTFDLQMKNVIITSSGTSTNNASAMAQNTFNTTSIKDVEFANPFIFQRDITGSITGVTYAAADAGNVASIKKGAAECFNTQFIYHKGLSPALETGVVGTRNTAYHSVNDGNCAAIEAVYDSNDVMQFAPGSNVNTNKTAMMVLTKAFVDMSGVILESLDRTVIQLGDLTGATPSQVVRPSPYETGPDMSSFNSLDVILTSIIPAIQPISTAGVPMVPYENLTVQYVPSQNATGLARRSDGSRSALEVRDLLERLRRNPAEADMGSLLKVARHGDASGVAELIKVSRRYATVRVQRRSFEIEPELSAIYSALAASGDEEALDHLVHLLRENDKTASLARVALMFAVSPTESTVRSYAAVAANDDDNLLTLGALLSTQPHRVAQDVMLPFLDAALSADADRKRTINTIYALGNMNGDLEIALDLLLRIAKDEHGIYDEDVRVAAVRALRKTMKSAGVRQTVEAILANPANPPRVRSAASKLLGHPTNPSPSAPTSSPLARRDFNTTAVSSTPVLATAWDSTDSPAYNVVSDLATRQADVKAMPTNKAYLVGEQFGWQLFSIQSSAGVFGGFGAASTGTCAASKADINFKALGAAGVSLSAFGMNVPLFEAEIGASHSPTLAQAHVMATAGGMTLLQQDLQFACQTVSLPIASTSFTPISLTYGIPIYLAVVEVGVSLTASFSAAATATLCPAPSAKVGLKPAVSVSVQGAGTVSVHVLKGSVTVTGTVGANIGPEIDLLQPADGGCSACTNLLTGGSTATVAVGAEVDYWALGWKPLKQWTLYSQSFPIADFSHLTPRVCTAL
ncbi:hypothetical protein HK101_005027 [Irineochytrium annulatum]|nr:hypothetical protein HK101_005027 [Irineochytrium annulatum]